MLYFYSPPAVYQNDHFCEQTQELLYETHTQSDTQQSSSSYIKDWCICSFVDK